MTTNKIKKPRIFISHSSKDVFAINNLYDVFDVNKNEVFYSAKVKSGIKAGRGICKSLDDEMTKCDVFMPIITENYIRSLYCIYELSVACYVSSFNDNFKILPICTNAKVFQKLKRLVDRFDLLAIYANIDSAVESIDGVLKPYLKLRRREGIKKFCKELIKADSLASAYIGGQYDYDNILKYCYTNGVKYMNSTHADNATLRAKIANADEVMIVTTTGDALVRNIKESITTALKNNCKISFCMPNRHSQFTDETSDIESATNSQTKKPNAARIAQEYNNTFVYLTEAYKIAKEHIKDKANLGSITLYCTYTSLRQTLIIARKGESYWIWCTLTMPSVRVVGGIPSIEYEANISESRTINAIVLHTRNMIEAAKKKGGVILLNEKSTPRPFALENIEAKIEWEKKIHKAQEYMSLLADQDVSKILIQVESSYPLIDGLEPNTEFINRLDSAINLYKANKAKHIETKIYVPGSLCITNGAKDKVSLSKAGCKYLLDHKIPKQDILGEEIEAKYKHTNGVYSSADACYVASKLFKDKKFTKLISVSSSNNCLRNNLFYIEFGIVAQCYGIPSINQQNLVLDELFDVLPNVLKVDSKWQNENSKYYKKSREELLNKNKESIE